MDDKGLAAAVKAMVAARRDGHVLRDFEGASAPGSLAEGYRMQEAFTAAWDDRVAGWKVGATSREVQALFGVSEPICAPVFARDVVHSPARVATGRFHHRMLESEFAFLLGRDLPARPRPYAREEIVAACDAVMPAMEIIGPRFDRLTVDRIPQLVADCGGNGGAVLGPACTDWQALDLPTLAVTLSVAGTPVRTGTGALALGGPLLVLEWLVEAFRTQGRGLARGQFVLTGTVTGIHAPAPGETAVADFGVLGAVSITFTD